MYKKLLKSKSNEIDNIKFMMLSKDEQDAIKESFNNHHTIKFTNDLLNFKKPYDLLYHLQNWLETSSRIGCWYLEVNDDVTEFTVWYKSKNDYHAFLCNYVEDFNRDIDEETEKLFLTSNKFKISKLNHTNRCLKPFLISNIYKKCPYKGVFIVKDKIDINTALEECEGKYIVLVLDNRYLHVYFELESDIVLMSLKADRKTR
jgi:hypothetical protein